MSILKKLLARTESLQLVRMVFVTHALTRFVRSTNTLQSGQQTKQITGTLLHADATLRLTTLSTLTKTRTATATNVST